MKRPLARLCVLALTCAATTAWASVTMYPGKAELLTAIHADIANPTGLATAQLTPRTAINATANNRAITIDSNISGTPRLMSWGNGIGAPNPVNITKIFTNGRPTTAFGCYLRVANNVNQSVGGNVTITLSTGDSLALVVPPAGMYFACTSSIPFDTVNIDADSGALVEMIDDVLIADAAGAPASDQYADAGLARVGSNNFDTRWTRNDPVPFILNGNNRGNSRDVWWTYVAPQDGVIQLAVVNNNFPPMTAIYEGLNGGPADITSPLFGTTSNFSTLIPVVAGKTYYIRVGGVNAAVGTGSLNLIFSPNCPSDFNNDRVVDFFDYLDFVQAFSSGC
jgi:hypothetical protein